MKKYLTSFVFVALFAGYAALQYLNSSKVTYAAANNAAQAQRVTTSVTAPQSAPPPQSQGQYADGTYTGSPEDAYWGTVQVQAVIKKGALANVQILQFPNSHGTSVYINDQALPILQSEAIQAQSANVNGVSSATYTSQAFQQSLASALSQAKS